MTMNTPSNASPIVIITGARGGVGRAVVQRALARGWRVAAVSRTPQDLSDLQVHARIGADVTTATGARDAVAQCTSLLGEGPTHLAHLVGNTLIAPLHRTSTEQAADILRVNLESALYVLGAWVDARRATLHEGRTEGAAVLASSVVARIGVANHEAIAAAKGGVEALARSAASTYASIGLRINVVAPGMTETPMTSGMLKVPAMREAAGKQYPLGGVQSADDVADTVDWLWSPQAARITGLVVPVDGGFTHIRPLVK
jgi:NAD(P)-dependent dehydrogenase (short-subunit alcohol dehydrogenase family)